MDGKVPHVGTGWKWCVICSYRCLQLLSQIVAQDDVLPNGTKIRAGSLLAYSPYLMGRGNHNCSSALMMPQLFAPIECSTVQQKQTKRVLHLRERIKQTWSKAVTLIRVISTVPLTQLLTARSLTICACRSRPVARSRSLQVWREMLWQSLICTILWFARV